MPTTKVIAGTVAGSATILLVWGLSLAHVAVPPEVASAITVLLGSVAAYIVPHSVPGAPKS